MDFPVTRIVGNSGTWALYQDSSPSIRSEYFLLIQAEDRLVEKAFHLYGATGNHTALASSPERNTV